MSPTTLKGVVGRPEVQSDSCLRRGGSVIRKDFGSDLPDLQLYGMSPTTLKGVVGRPEVQSYQLPAAGWFRYPEDFGSDLPDLQLAVKTVPQAITADREVSNIAWSTVFAFPLLPRHVGK